MAWRPSQSALDMICVSQLAPDSPCHCWCCLLVCASGWPDARGSLCAPVLFQWRAAGLQSCPCPQHFHIQTNLHSTGVKATTAEKESPISAYKRPACHTQQAPQSIRFWHKASQLRQSPSAHQVHHNHNHAFCMMLLPNVQTSSLLHTCLGGTRPDSCCCCLTAAGVAQPLLMAGSLAALAPRAWQQLLMSPSPRLLVLPAGSTCPSCWLVVAGAGGAASAGGLVMVMAAVPSMPKEQAD